MKRLLPRDQRFYQFFLDAAENVRDVSQALADLLLDYTDVEYKVRRLENLEHRGDEINHRVRDALNTTFLTPFDREDVQHLAHAVDDFVDYITAAAVRLVLYRIEQPTKPAQILGQILAEQGAAIADALTLLSDEKKWPGVIPLTVEINRLENEADDLLNQALAELFEGAEDIPALIKAIRWGELYHRLEDAADRGEDLANMLEELVLK